MKDRSFTEALNNLQNTASEISKQATTLEDALKLFDEGMKDAEYCMKILEEADQKISVFTREEIDA